jgi:hypothetical protein
LPLSPVSFRTVLDYFTLVFRYIDKRRYFVYLTASTLAMGFIVGLIVNVVLLSIPIASTLGTLFGIRPFENEREPIAVDLNALVSTALCDEFHEFAQNKNGFNYTREFPPPK